MRIRVALALVTPLLCAPALASADPFHFQVSAGTDAPLAVSLRGDVELPGRLRVMASVGVTPSLYLDAFNGVISAAGGGSQTSAGPYGLRLDRGSMWRVHAGWRPFPGAGLLLMGGYGRLTLSGDASARELITTVTGQPPPAQVPEANGVYDVTSTLHTVSAELGWEFTFFGDHLVIQTAVGFVGTVDSRTAITPQFVSTTPGAAEARVTAQGYIDQVLQSYVFLPTFSLSLGYRFL
ncbi:MAG: hypothetical protein Q8S73_02995 [Deltaproteobacteria bacterium]|nr:hypothetical protein [Myxococcales bacterium]MDP3213046.1 hypothetical protein [Deltaproteobacteria bacterium]